MVLDVTMTAIQYTTAIVTSNRPFFRNVQNEEDEASSSSSCSVVTIMVAGGTIGSSLTVGKGGNGEADRERDVRESFQEDEAPLLSSLSSQASLMSLS